jgi:glycosyltransferase involved in cell wall biosynthesis
MTSSEGPATSRRKFPASIDIVIPCYNETATLPITAPAIIEFLQMVIASEGASCRLRLILVDDGSRDETWETICGLTREFPEVTGLKLARNYGHQNALLAGLAHSDADVTISIDADLQDDLAAMGKMIDRYRDGAEIVFGVRAERTTDSLFKRATAIGFYRFMKAIKIDLVHNHADYRLMSRKAIQALMMHDEANLFLRGLISTMGFSTTTVTYARTPRIAGETSYTLRKMIGLALTGLLAFSSIPLRLIAITGFFASLVSLGVAFWVIASTIFDRSYIVPGWASILLPISLFASLQMLSAGIIGEYVGRIYLEVKRRPRFLVDHVESAGQRDQPDG